MNSKWEFDCPQFVDFSAGLEDVHLDSELQRSPKLESESSLSSSIMNSGKGPRMATPNLKVKPIDLRHSPYVNTVRPILTDDEKIAKFSKKHRRMSRSDSCLDKIATSKEPKIGIRGRDFISRAPKRSLSEDCFKRKRLCPTTPMCLKRTLSNAKPKGKTTEELELEKIKELQRQMSKQLKLNKVNMKRAQNMKNPYGLDELYKVGIKVLPATKGITEQPLPEVKITGKPRCFQENAVEKSIVPKEESFNQMLKKKGENLRKTLSKVRCASVSRALHDLNSNEKDIQHGAIRKVPFQKHSGIKFCPTQKQTVPRPFSFDSSSSRLPNASFKLSDSRACFSSSAWTPNVTADKENVFLES